MVTVTCRLCHDASIKDPTVAEILAHKSHPDHKRVANPHRCPIGPDWHKGQLNDPAHLCRRHREQIGAAPVFPGELSHESAVGIAHAGGSAGDTSFDAADVSPVIVLPSLGFEREAEAVERGNILSKH